MDIENLRQNWALWVAAVLAILVAGIVTRAVLKRTARGQLRHAVGVLRQAQREAEKATKSVVVAQQAVDKLAARASSVKPRLVEEAKGALGDAAALKKIADDRVLVAANLLRRVIYEEHPPNKHVALRKKYLPGDGPDDRPFSF